MSRVAEPYLVRSRAGRPGDWQVWIRPLTGLPPDVCAYWTRRSLALAPYAFRCAHPWPRSQGAADRYVVQLIEYLRTAAPPPPPEGPLVSSYVKLFTVAATSPRAQALAAAGRPYSPDTLETYRACITRYVVPDAAFCALRMGAVTRDDLEAFFARLLARLGGACRVHQDTWQILHMVFRTWADAEGRPSPFVGMPKPTYQETIRGALMPDELAAIFARPFPSPMARAICALAFWAGLRRGEVFALRWSDVDPVSRRIVVEHAVKRFVSKKRSEGGTKGGRARVVPMVRYVAEALAALPHYGEYVIAFPPTGRPGAVAPRAKRPNVNDWRDAMRGALAGIDVRARKITPHSSRHSIASILLAQGVPKEDIRKILGHFDERTTDGYLHMARDAIERMTAGLDGRG